jgi:3-oxoacyl-[acyl-carrier protein] reductase
MRLQNKIAIVTGAGSGFGEGIAKRFTQEGCKVVVNDINVEGSPWILSARSTSW